MSFNKPITIYVVVIDDIQSRKPHTLPGWMNEGVVSTYKTQNYFVLDISTSNQISLLKI